MEHNFFVIIASNFRLQTSIRLQSDLRPQTSDFRLQTSDFRLQTSDFRLQTSDFRLQTSDFRLQASTEYIPGPPGVILFELKILTSNHKFAAGLDYAVQLEALIAERNGATVASGCFCHLGTDKSQKSEFRSLKIENRNLKFFS